MDEQDPRTASAALEVVFDLAASHGAPPGARFAYATTVRFARSEGTWHPLWEPALVHPALAGVRCSGSTGRPPPARTSWDATGRPS